MSDPVTNVDIEDVLASIRRLVLQSPPEGRPTGPAPGSTGRGRLVLTQALRVEEPEPEVDPAAGDDSWTHDRIDADADEVPGPADEGGDRLDPSEDQVEPSSGEVRPAAAVQSEPDEAKAAALPPLVLSSPLPPGRTSNLRGIEAALTVTDTDWEPDGSEADAALDWSIGGVAASPAAVPLFRHRASPSRVTPPLDLEPSARAAPVDETSVSLRHASTDRPASAPSLSALDDDRLRALVTEVLRAELQGELGERITRNVRKLVRREIFRILETREED